MSSRFLLTLLICTFGLKAEYKLDSKKMKDVIISNSGITRITLSDDEITDVISPVEVNKGFVLHPSGNLYIRGAEIVGKTSISLISGKGNVQDLRIIPRAIATNHPIIFIAPPKSNNSRKAITNYLGEFIRGVVPSGFSIIAKEFPPRGFRHIKAVPEYCYVNKQYQVLCFSVTCSNSKATALSSRTMRVSQLDLAMSFDKKSLKKGESAKLYVVQKLTTHCQLSSSDF